MPIGFLANIEKKKEEKKLKKRKKAKAKKVPEPLPEGEAFLRFDSGRGISFDDSQRLVGVFGASGTGKSYQGVIPAMVAAIRRGGMVIIIDPKGTLGSYARGAAEACGRGADIVEYGTQGSAIPMNILEGADESGFYDLLMQVYRRFCDGGKSHNMDFHASACSVARDIFTLVNRMAATVKEKEPKKKPLSCTLPLILKFLIDPTGATEVFQNYISSVELDVELSEFAKRIQNSPFHVLNQVKTVNDIDHIHQVSFHTHGAIEAISNFLEEDGIREKFCCPSAPGLDFDACEGKIVLLRFGAGSGGSAAALCRMVLEAFYARVYRKGVDAVPVTLVIDEFQEVADMSRRRLSDVAFFAMAREFKCGIIVATQSYSALAALSDADGLHALTANLNSKIFLHSEDPMTRGAAMALGSPDPIGFQKEVFAATYDTRTRTYYYGTETLDDAYSITCSIDKAEAPVVHAEFTETTLYDVAKLVNKLNLRKKCADMDDEGHEMPQSHYIRRATRRDFSRKKYDEAMRETENNPVPF